MTSLSPRPGKAEEITNIRAQISIRLLGGPDGRIGLEDLAAVANGVQGTTHQLARALVDRSGRGRSPSELKKLVTLYAVAITDGSAVVELELPELGPTLPIDEVDHDVGIQAVALVGDALAAVSGGAPVPEQLAGPPADTLRSMLSGLRRYQEIEWIDRIADQTRHIRLVPAIAAQAIKVPAAPSESQEETVVGELYAVNLHTRTYRIDDPVRGSVKCDLGQADTSLQDLRQMIGRQVVARGYANYDVGGSIAVLSVLSLEMGSEYGEEFYKFDVAAALDSVKPVETIKGLEISDLTSDEATAFLDILAE